MKKKQPAHMVQIGIIQIRLQDVLDALTDEQIKGELEARDLDDDYREAAYQEGWNDKGDEHEGVEPLLLEDLNDLKRTVAAGDLSHLSIVYSRLEAIAQ